MQHKYKNKGNQSHKAQQKNNQVTCPIKTSMTKQFQSLLDKALCSYMNCCKLDIFFTLAKDSEVAATKKPWAIHLYKMALLLKLRVTTKFTP